MSGSGTWYRPGTRYDAAIVDAYMREHSAHVPRGQLDVYAGYWLARQTVAQVAELDGVSTVAVERRIVRLRVRVRKWVARNRPASRARKV